MGRPTVGSLFSGVGGFDLGFDAAGWETRWQVEVDERCASVLARHWPDIPRFADVRHVFGAELPPVDCITYGFPCQDLSVAGNRAGLDGDRSGLFFEAIRIIREMREATDGRYPTWAVAENVAGLLSADDGAAMGRCLDALADIGAVGIEWAVLDAQHFGVPQRRRRVFIVACFDPRRFGADPLFPVAARCQRHSAPSGATGEGTTGRVARSIAVRGREEGAVVELADDEIAFALRTPGGGSSVPAALIERERDGERVDESGERRPGRQSGASWAPDRAAPLLAGEGRGYRNDVDGTTWVIE